MRARSFSSSILVIATAAWPTAANAQARARRASFDGKLTSCRVPALDEEVMCGRFEVFEDRLTSTGRRIALNVVVLPATTDSVLGDPMVFLAGGGVVPATRYARYLSTALPALRRNRDIVLVDQRGTGGSNPLTCDRATLDTSSAVAPDARYLLYIAACGESLRSRADVRFYTTSFAVDDLDDLRAWLGYGTIDLYSASYGTSVAATYIRQHGDHVRTVVMHGVVPLDVPMQAELATSAQHSLDAVLRLCEADSSCKAAYPELQRDLTTALTSGGQPFREGLNAALSALPSIRSVPMMIHDAASGGAPGPGGPPPGPEPAPLGVRLSILCSEGITAIDASKISSMTRGTFLGEFPVRFQMRWCEGWPTRWLPASFRAPFRSDVPALLLTGELDPITPSSYADRVSKWFANGVALTLPRRSHSDTDPCVAGMIESFIVSGGKRPDASCLASTPPIQFSTRR